MVKRDNTKNNNKCVSSSKKVVRAIAGSSCVCSLRTIVIDDTLSFDLVTTSLVNKHLEKLSTQTCKRYALMIEKMFNQKSHKSVLTIYDKKNDWYLLVDRQESKIEGKRRKICFTFTLMES